MLKALATLRAIVKCLGLALCDRSPGSCRLYMQIRVRSEDNTSVNLLEAAFNAVKEFYQGSMMVKILHPGARDEMEKEHMQGSREA